MILKATVGPREGGMRLDEGAARLFPQLSRKRIRKIIDWGGCAVAGTMVRVASRPLRVGEEIVMGVMEPERFRELVYTRDDLILDDPEYLAVNKGAGINCQRTPYQLKGTVEYAVTSYLRSIGSREPARVVHRLDRGTSGVMIFPKTGRAAAHISTELKGGRVEKVYLALVSGIPEREQWEVNAPIGRVARGRYGVTMPGREAITRFAVIALGGENALVEARPITGRTHQIRVHLAHGGLPIVGDSTYGREGAPRMMLHCLSMSFTAGDGRRLSAQAPPDREFRTLCAERGITLP